MDTEDKGNIISNQAVESSGIHINKDTSIQQMVSNEMELANEMESVTPKETVVILSVELVTPGTELANSDIKLAKQIADETIMEESVTTSVLEKIEQLQESELNKVNETMVAVTETSNDDNMESENFLETSTNAEDFSSKTTAILTGIENIQSSVDMEDSASSNLQRNTTKSTSLPTTAASGLILLAQYVSDNDQISDTDSVIEVPLTSAKDYRPQVVEINSDSDSDESDSSSGVEYLNEIRRTIEKRTELMDDEDEEEDDDDNEENVGKRRHKPKLKVKGEMLLDDLPSIQDLQITVPEEECIEFGKIHSIVDQLLLVTVLPGAILLDLETVIFLEKGQKVLGKVFDVLGQVADPLYCVRFNSNKQIKEKDINVGDIVYVAPKTQYTQYVILSSLMKLKGSDASWENDIEPPPKFLDYSDDEQEQMARRQRRNSNRPIDNDDPTKRPRTSGDDRSENSNFNRSHTIHQRNSYGYNNQNRIQRQQQSNNSRNSWHSNYYPQQYQGPPPPNYGYGPNTGAPLQNQLPTPRPQNYPDQMSMYGMPPMHTMPFPPPAPYGPQGGILHMPPHQLMPNSFGIRPPALHHGAYHQQHFTSPPPPPGSQ